jgi:hypothetical protein
LIVPLSFAWVTGVIAFAASSVAAECRSYYALVMRVHARSTRRLDDKPAKTR